ncbi:MAG: hypothetical protein QOH44_1149, partial [Actinomycetota bacterium]|nr:hypothetical protein [Actinomycetota bacterium]
ELLRARIPAGWLAESRPFEHGACVIDEGPFDLGSAEVESKGKRHALSVSNVP